MENVRAALKGKALDALYKAAEATLHENSGNWKAEEGENDPDWLEQVFGCAHALLQNGCEMMGAELLAELMEAAETAPQAIRMRVFTTVIVVLGGPVLSDLAPGME